MARAKSAPKDSTAHLGFEAKLWLAADKLRNNMDAAEYKHVVLGLIFLKYISDSFEDHRAKLAAGHGDYAGANPEDPDEYRAENVFWVPKEARWSRLQGRAKLPSIGKDVDDAMVAIERDNPRLKGVLPKDYARPGLDKHRLGELIDLIGTIGLGDKESRSKDIQLAKQLSAADKRGEALGLSHEEIAFYDALATNDSAIQAMGDAKLRVIAAELVTQVRKSVTIDWTLREGAQAKIRVMVKRILNRFGYPPDLQEAAVKEVLAQAALLCADWAA